MPAGAAAEAGVILTLPGGGTASIPSAALVAGAERTVEERCVLRGSAAEEPDPTSHRGLPVREALAEYAELEAVGYLTIPRPNGTVAYLPGSYFEEPALFEGCSSPLFSSDERSARFFRPPLAGDPDDVNAEDNIATTSGEPLVVGVHDGNVVKVLAIPSATSTSAGSPVRFTASVSDVIGAEEFIYSWSFGDGTTAGGESVSHTYSGTGTYVVRVTASGLEGSGGESGPVEVVVGNPPTTTLPGASTGPQPTAQEPDGAPGKGSPGRGGKSGKTGPGATGTAARGDNDPAHRPGNSAGLPSTHRHDSKAPVRSPARSTSVPPETVATAPPLGPGTAPEAPAIGLSQGQAPGGSEAPNQPAPSAPSANSEDLVEGRLVGNDLGPTTIDEGTDNSPAGHGSPSGPGAVGGRGLGAPVGALIVVALLACGAIFEWRRSRPIS